MDIVYYMTYGVPAWLVLVLFVLVSVIAICDARLRFSKIWLVASMKKDDGIPAEPMLFTEKREAIKFIGQIERKFDMETQLLYLRVCPFAGDVESLEKRGG